MKATKYIKGLALLTTFFAGVAMTSAKTSLTNTK